MACDVTDHAAMSGLIDDIRAAGGLAGVVHAAGVVRDGVLDRVGVADVERVFGAKVGGAVVLDELTRGLDLSLFVVFSSVAGVWGGGGQGVYAAANAVLDGLVERRRVAGLVGTSVAWGPWAGGGMAAGDPVVVERLARDGLVGMDPALALVGLEWALAGDVGLPVVADVRWERFGVVFTASRRSALFSELSEVDQVGVASGGLDLVGLAGPAREALVLGVVRQQVAQVLGHASSGAVSVRRSFRDLGFDSLTAVELRNRLVSVTGLSLPATLVFDYPTPQELAGHIVAELTGDQAVTTVVSAAVHDDDPIVIVGMGCRYPGNINNPEDLWHLISEGRDAMAAIPSDRGWNVEDWYDPESTGGGTSYVAEGGFLTGAGDFDAGFFGISPREALAMDPQQRLLLEVSWEALERAGVDPGALKGTATGVFVGAAAPEYGPRLHEGAGDFEGYLLTGNASSVASGRVAYTLGLEGPAVTIDTACSSSLVALHLAVQSLRSGESSLALAGGVTVMSSPGVFIEFSRQGGL
ncbi:beta-ketoacyl synthase N-terminal-like domain-containing protein, partial [Polymorphospora rubra]